MTTSEVVDGLAASLAAAGYPVSLAPAVPAIRPAVTVGPPTITPIQGVCTGPRELAVTVRVTGAGTDPVQVSDLYQAVDDVLTAVPAAWTVEAARPVDDATDDPAYQIALTLETTWP